MGSEHISTSAKTGAGVLEVFTNLAKSIYSRIIYNIIEIQVASLEKTDKAPKTKVNTRGVLKVSGYADFDPQMNV